MIRKDLLLKDRYLSLRKIKSTNRIKVNREFYDFIDLAYQNQSFDYPRKTQPKWFQLCINNYLTNLVTALEVYLKNCIIHGIWNENGFEKLLQDKITLNEAYTLFKKQKITRSFIVSQSSSFQNLETIDRIFSQLTGSAFIKSIDAHKIIDDIKPYSLHEHQPNWKKSMQRIFEIRNSFIHEGYIGNFEEIESFKINSIVIDFHQAVDDYLAVNGFIR